ncbi:DNA polymerase IV [Smaragdicoccus niigatensis]|uniref:DNA polymerase IV n=1 Tax=Smaragdicoccus niigatensis TaxID=359359 RepID=UPI00035C5F2A|nr:DNA polymerase IV [Smaragdicoccus niigatensis]
MFVSETILHADLDSFYASVEQRDDPSLRGKPVLVGGGVVLAASYEAKAFGVKSGKSASQALRVCPHAIVVPPRMKAYTEASRAVFEVFRDTTPLVEPLSVDEAFLEVGGLLRLAGDPLSIAVRLRAEVRDKVGLPITVGIARSKFLAKVASAVAKPDGLRLVPADAELEFLHPLPIERLWGVGQVTSTKLHAFGIRTVGQLAATSESDLSTIVGGGAARHLHALSWARDPRRVETGRRRRSIGSQRALGRRALSVAEREQIVLGIVDGLGKRLRNAGRFCRTVVLRLRFGDFTRATRSRTMHDPTQLTASIWATARELLAEASPLIDSRGVTLLGISLTNLTSRDDPYQLELPLHKQSSTALDEAVDSLRDRFGRAAVTRAGLLGHDPGLSVPMLPD